jgi:hypothetical protein
MQLPDDVKAIRARYVAAFPVPTGEPGPEHEERVRQWTIRFAEQVAHDLPGQGYGVKRADGGRPIGKDSLARKVGDRIDGWDLLIGAGDGTPEIADNPAYHDLSDQVFVPVTPTNHLPVPDSGNQNKPDPGGNKPDPGTVDLSALLAQLQHIASRVDDIRADLVLTKAIAKAIHDKPEPVITWPPYQTSIRFVGTVTSTPKV